MPKSGIAEARFRPETPGKPGLMDLGSDDGLIDAYVAPDDSDDDHFEARLQSEVAFSSSEQVFVVRELSRATPGFRPHLVCEGFLAKVLCTTAGYTLSPLGRDQQLSFKYEPPSPKFSRKLPGCISYRLQLLHGSQFLYSLRGLPKTVRCQRASNALEWGPVHVVFAVAADMDVFLATLKYVDVQEMGSTCEGSSVPSGAGQEEAPVRPAGCPGAASSVRSPTAGVGGYGISTCGTQWPPYVAPRHRVESRTRGDALASHAIGSHPSASHSHGPPLFAATASAAVLAAVAAACLLTHRGPAGPSVPGRRRAADAPGASRA